MFCNALWLCSYDFNLPQRIVHEASTAGASDTAAIWAGEIDTAEGTIPLAASNTSALLPTTLYLWCSSSHFCQRRSSHRREQNIDRRLNLRKPLPLHHKLRDGDYQRTGINIRKERREDSSRANRIPDIEYRSWMCPCLTPTTENRGSMPLKAVSLSDMILLVEF